MKIDLARLRVQARARIMSLEKRTWLWIGAVLAAAVLAFVFDREREPASKIAPENIETASTFIPAGFVLVPIEVANFESLDSILGKFGVVDLYLPASELRAKPLKVASHVKILRAPLNPSHFAVLVAEEDSARLVTETGAFTVVVQNPNRRGTGFVNGALDNSENPKRSSRRTSRIAVEVHDAGS